MSSSIRATARWAAALNILSAVPDGFSVTVLRNSVVRGDAATTAANVLASEGQFRLGFVADLGAILIFVASAVLLYEIFKPADRRAALLYLVFLVMGSAFQSLGSIQDLAALALLKGGATMSALPAAQANDLAYLFLRLHSSTYQLGLLFMGCSSLVMGFLVMRSTFVPRIIGPLVMVDGLGVLTFCLAAFLTPPLATRIFPYVPLVTVAIGEGSLYLWLLARGVNAERWREQAAATERAALAWP